ncbi:MAG: RIP metalloprotease RseP [Saprospiraceae bacterium]
MDILSYAFQLILSLSILVVLHEFGHYLPAKWFKTRVEKFYLFFNPKFSLYKKQIGETEWGIGWIPFGGYVKIAGMIDESMDKEQMEQPAQPWEFRSKPAWQRLIIMVGGVTVNFLLGIFLFAMIMFIWGQTYVKTADAKYGIAVDSMGMKLGLMDGDLVLACDALKIEKVEAGLVLKEIVLQDAKQLTVLRNGQEVKLSIPDGFAKEVTKYENKGKTLYHLRMPFEMKSVTKGGNAEKAGLLDNDKILTVEGEPAVYLHDFRQFLSYKKGSTASFQIVRNDKDTILLDIPVDEKGNIGIGLESFEKYIPISRQTYGFLSAIPKGWSMSVNFLGDQLKAFGQMFSGKLKAKDNLGSVFSIATMFDASWDWEQFWRITASLSILLAFFNLLPIPALDGGYVLFLFWEIITGKAPNDKFMEVVTYVGFLILMALMVYAVGLDISRWF